MQLPNVNNKKSRFCALLSYIVPKSQSYLRHLHSSKPHAGYHRRDHLPPQCSGQTIHPRYVHSLQGQHGVVINQSTWNHWSSETESIPSVETNGWTSLTSSSRICPPWPIILTRIVAVDSSDVFTSSIVALSQIPVVARTKQVLPSAKDPKSGSLQPEKISLTEDKWYHYSIRTYLYPEIFSAGNSSPWEYRQSSPKRHFPFIKWEHGTWLVASGCRKTTR